MKRSMYNRFLPAVLVATLVAITHSSPTQAEEGYGSISGRFILKGDVPKTEFLIKDGLLAGTNAKPKNADICAASDLPSDALVVDPKTKGIGNIFIYLRKAPKQIHPDLKAVPKKELMFDQKACRFFPHAMFVRAGQTVRVLNGDNCGHNTHTYPLRNEANNFVVPANFRKGVPLVHEAAEILPMKVGCDIHPWMSAYWLILDHPYAAVTVAKQSKEKGAPLVGSFKIDKLPAGDYEFRVWHEKTGYIGVGTRRGFKVTIKSGSDVEKTFEVPASTFTE
ncbi:MAG: methylamine utilization protein [Planctomycetaceae bacterium]